jgi:hypothetical protein
MEIQLYTPKLYSTLEFWWAVHKWPAVPQEALPSTGLVVVGPNGPICAGFLYSTDSSLAWLEWVVGNPLCDKILRDEALDLLIPALLAEAHKSGKSQVFSSVQHPALLKRYKKFGALEADTNMTNVIWRL